MTADTTDKSKNVSRFFKWLLSILFFICFSLILIIYVFLDPIVKNRIINGVYTSTQGLYTLEIRNLDAHFWTGAITMEKVWLRPDTVQFRMIREKNDTLSASKVNLYFNSVNISRIRWFRYLMNNEKLEIGQVHIDRPDFIVHSYVEENRNFRLNDKNFLNLLPGIIAAFTGSLRIEQIKVSNGHLHYDVHGKTGVVHQLADSVYLDLQKIVIDTNAAKNDLYADKAFLDLKNYQLLTPDNLNMLKIQHAYGSVHDSLLSLTYIHYFKKDSVQEKYKDAMDIKLSKIESRGVDYGNLLRDQKIFLRAMILHEPDVTLLSSENPIEPAKNKKDNSGDSTLLDHIVPYLSGSFRIDTLSVHNGKIHYEIKNQQKYIIQKADNIYLKFSRVLVDTAETGSKIYAENMSIKLKNYSLNKEHASELRIASMDASLSDSLLWIKNVYFLDKRNDSYFFTADHIKGTGVDYRTMLEKKKATIHSLTIHAPEILTIANETKRDNKFENSQSFFENALGPLADASLNAKIFKIEDADIKFVLGLNDGIIEQRAEHLFLQVNGLSVDSASASRLDFFDALKFSFRNYILKVHKENFELGVKHVSGSSKRQDLELKAIHLNQIHSLSDTQRYYFTDFIHKTSIGGFDYQRLLRHQELHAGKLDVQDMHLNVFLDAHKANKPFYASKVPQEMMQKLTMYLRIDTATFRNARILFKNQALNVEEPAVLSFEQLNFQVVNFTNDKNRMTDSTPAVVNGSALLMGKGYMEARITLPLLSEGFNATFEGTVDTIEGKNFNSLTRLGGMEVTSGTLLPSRFKGTIVNGVSNGEMEFVYENLHVQLLDEHEEASEKFRSKLANAVVKNNNPNDDDEAPEIVQLHAERAPQDGFFFFLWKTLQTGIIETVTKSTLYTEK